MGAMAKSAKVLEILLQGQLWAIHVQISPKSAAGSAVAASNPGSSMGGG